MEKRTDELLVPLAQRGDRVAAGELFERHYGSSLRIARRILSGQTECEDAVQSAYLSAFQHFGDFRGESSFKTWIMRIVVNSCLMTIRGPWRRVSLVELPEAEILVASRNGWARDVSPEESALHAEIAIAHDTALKKMPRTIRTVYALHTLSQMPIADVAHELGLTVAATKSRAFRARHVMQVALSSLRTGPVVRHKSRENQARF